MATLEKEERDKIKKHGYSFNSKLVAQGPHFFNLRIMCQCFGRAVMKHVEFSESVENKICWFLDEMTQPEDDDLASFSYEFKDDLKITTDLTKAKLMRANTDQNHNNQTINEDDSDYEDDFEPDP